MNKIFESYPEIKLVYFFGSKSQSKDGPLSDYDFGIYLDSSDKNEMFDIRIKLQSKISEHLKTDKIDLVILNLTESPELKYNIIKEGKLIFEKKPFKVLIEPKILNEYFDFNYTLSMFGLTKSQT